MEATRPLHGEERNRRTEIRHGKPVTMVTPDGAVAYEGPSSSETRTVAEKYCGHCREWVSTGSLGWLFGFIMCPKCKRGWDEQPAA